MEKSKVYFTKEITPESLVKIYQALGVELKGKVGVKISTGEPGGNNYLHAELIGKLVKKLNGTIIECCTAYEGRRMDPKEHWKAIKEHGLRIPEDVSVASIDDIDTAQYLTPSLTTTHIPLDEMGQMAAKILIDRIEGGHSKHVKILFPYDIIERNSTAGPKKI